MNHLLLLTENELMLPNKNQTGPITRARALLLITDNTFSLQSRHIYVWFGIPPPPTSGCPQLIPRHAGCSETKDPQPSGYVPDMNWTQTQHRVRVPVHSTSWHRAGSGSWLNRNRWVGDPKRQKGTWRGPKGQHKTTCEPAVTEGRERRPGEGSTAFNQLVRTPLKTVQTSQ